MAKQIQTHEKFIAQVAKLAISMGDLNPTERTSLQAIKMVYGAGNSGTRGITYFNRWKGPEATVPFVEVCAFGQESVVQVCGTTIHELGHVLAGWEAGHGKGWHDACGKLGLGPIKAAGTDYSWELFAPKLRSKLQALEPPADGNPASLASLLTGQANPLGGLFPAIGKRLTLKPCGAGIGTKGGKSRGAGSGSRLRKYVCGCGQIIRAATDSLKATHNPCGKPFVCD